MSMAAFIAPRRDRRFLIALCIMPLLVLVAAVFHLAIGARYIPARTVLAAFLHYDPNNFSHRIIIDLRMLRLTAALLVGAALGVAGLLLQSVIRNPLGEPHILGLNAGAALAVVISTLWGSSWMTLTYARPLAAAGGAAALFALVLSLSSAGRNGLTLLKLTLCGVVLSAFASSLTAAILILDEQTLLDLRTWLVGDLAGLSWDIVRAGVWPIAIAMLLGIWLIPSLNALALGDQIASGLGVNLLRTRLLAIAAIALLSGSAVAMAGPIGFVGLIVPNIVRRLVTDDLRLALPLSALCGTLVLLVADIAARTLFMPHELATGVMTALVGAPVFLFIVSRFFK
ncbi:FecCD family ABC transporter permease [Sodalis ligni]|uniref:Iron complex transport system permease protein n=1 Tax=Sodalis ligni TaxID=2697027 RepID=A0A4R1N975_9GAMM|nr:iron ABC transporter permease [Sodalis ligni]TCL02061.1 iron complex transport system permease protein [Sodalis ligni]